MDKWLINMAAGATLSALLVIFGASTFFDIIYPKGGGAEPEAEHAAADSGGSGSEPVAAEPETPFPVLLSAASVEKGQKEAKKCAACHTFDEGGLNKIGPNLHGIVGRKVASHEGFAFSQPMIDFGGEWTYERLDCFLHDPKKCVSGTKMSFAGVRKDSARADVLVYLKSISPDAPPLPAPTEAASAESAPESEAASAAEPAPEPASSEPQQADSAGNTGNETESAASGTPQEPASASTVQN